MQGVFSTLDHNYRKNRYLNHWRTKTGQRRLIQWSNTIIEGTGGEVEFVVGAGLDITDQKATESALQHSEALFEAVFNQAYQFIGMLAPDGTIRNVNQTALDFAGVTAEALVGLKFWDAPFWEHSEPAQTKVKRVVQRASQGEFERMEVTHIRYDGEKRFVDFSLKPIRDNAGEVFMLIPEGRDITERKKAEEVLRLSEEKYRILVENAHDAIFISQDGMLQYANQSTEALIGYSATELLHTPFTDHIHPDDRNTVISRHQARLDGGNTSDYHSFRLLDRSGAIKWVEINTIRIDWEGQPAIMGFARDITSQKQMESQLLQSQKMDAIGTLAGGIAYDFNNNLQAISGYTQLLLMDDEGSDRQKEMLATIGHACDHARELTTQLLTFSRKIESRLAPLDLNTELRSVMKLLRRTLPRMIDIETRLADDLPIVMADPVQFEQIIMNLSINAGHAMPDGGRLSIETGKVNLDENYCRSHLGAVPGAYAMMSITDTGHGMDAQTRSHIFEPFFTTREIGAGTGLGLAMVYGIVKSHKGYITCDSTPGHGTAFRIYVPAVAGVSVPQPLSEDQSEIKGGHELIMVVDDDPALRQLGRQFLERFGYQVCNAEDGETALREYRHRGSTVDLIILDLNMPGMGGARCLEEIKRLNPSQPVLISSGYSPSGQAKTTLEGLAQGFVGKPYALNDLLRAVRNTLDQQG